MTEDKRKAEESRRSPDAVRDDPGAGALGQAQATHPHGAHEVKDAGARVLTILGLVIIGLVILGLLGSRGLLAVLSGGGAGRLSPSVGTTVPPTRVQLQIDPEGSIERYRATAEAELNSYGWVDQNAGLARIPITRAMTLVTQGVLPGQIQANPTPAAAPTPGG